MICYRECRFLSSSYRLTVLLLFSVVIEIRISATNYKLDVDCTPATDLCVVLNIKEFECFLLILKNSQAVVVSFCEGFGGGG